MKNNKMLGNILLLITAMIWGAAFVFQRVGMESIGPAAFTSARMCLAALTAGTALFFLGGKKPEADKRGTGRDTVLGGICCGLFLAAASLLQQYGIVTTTAGKAGFITALYILMVPIFSVVLRKRIRPIIWPCAAGAVCGLYLLCIKGGFQLQRSDLYVLACAAVYAVHILIIDRISPHVDGIKLSCLQFLVSGVFSGVGMLLFEEVNAELLKGAAVSIAYSGIMSSGVAYTLQILGQQRTEPTLASMLMSLESVFALLTGFLVLREVPTLREGLGCLIMFAAIIVAQLPDKKTPVEAVPFEEEKEVSL